MKELEAKFLLQQGARRKKVLRHALRELSWAGFFAHPRRTTRIEDTYYDTAKGELQRAGWTLRTRHKNGQFQLTCKQLTTPHAGMFSRQELEQITDPVSVEHLAQNRHQLERGLVTELLNKLLSPASELEPLFDVSTQRQLYRLTSPEHPGSHIELALDQTQITAASTLCFVELEAELKRGPAELLKEVSMILDNQPQLLRARVSKYQRGLQAADSPPLDLLRKQTDKLKPTSAWVDLGIKHLNTQARTLRQVEPLAWEGVHIEAVHQMRVAIRRVRAALHTFDSVRSAQGGDDLAAEVRWLGRRLGAVRDLDVQLIRLKAYADILHPQDQKLLRNYRSHLLNRRSKTHKALRTALAGRRFTCMQRDFQRFLERTENQKLGFEFRSVEDMARETVLPALQDIQRRGRKVNKSSPPGRLHRLRIEIKRLRYQLEILREPYGRDLKRSTRRLSKLQNTLGDHQDACVAIDQLRIYRIHHELGKRENQIFKRLLRLEAEKAERCRKLFFKDWAKFEAEARTLKRLFA